MDIERAKEIIKKSTALIIRIQDKAQNENRELNREETALIAELEGSIEVAKMELPEKPLTNPLGHLNQSRGFDRNVMVFQDSEGKAIEAFSNAKQFSALNKEERVEGIGPGSLGKILRAKILGDPIGLNPHEFKALGESVGGAGGWFVSPQLSSYTIDLARNRSCVLLAGG